MGLFHKKPKLDDPSTFYRKCIDQFHETTKEFEQAAKGAIVVPELILLGSQAIQTALNNPAYRQALGPSSGLYCIVMIEIALETGLVYAALWHEDYDALKKMLAKEIANSGPDSYMGDILQKDLGMSEERFKDLRKKLTRKWFDLHEPYWDLKDPSEYTFRALVAMYQTGVSMELAKLGY